MLIWTNLTTWLSKKLREHGRIAGAPKLPHGNAELHSNLIWGRQLGKHNGKNLLGWLQTLLLIA